MNITINGEERSIEASTNLQNLLNIQGYKDKLVATALNGDFVPRSQYDQTTLNEGDQIEIVAPMQGG